MNVLIVCVLLMHSIDNGINALWYLFESFFQVALNFLIWI